MVTINERDRIDWHEGLTVRDVLEVMGYSYALITVTVDGTLVPHEDWASYRVPDEARISVFHLAHGG
jgi:thiamine biosynthesis protein ThiS